MTRRSSIIVLLPLLGGLSCGKIASNEPWIHQARLLKENSQLFWDFQKQHNGKWPSSMNDLRSVLYAAHAPRRVHSFRDPKSGLEMDWLVFNPTNGKPVSEHGRIVAAAPITGSKEDKGFLVRMVMFETGVVTWISESEFKAAVK